MTDVNMERKSECVAVSVIIFALSSAFWISKLETNG